MGGYPGGPDLGEDGPVFGGGYGPQGYVDNGYERGRPYGGEYVGGAPQYYGAERYCSNCLMLLVVLPFSLRLFRSSELELSFLM